MEKRIVIAYDIVNREIKIDENEFSTFEAFGILEAAKQMIADNWLKNTETEEER